MPVCLDKVSMCYSRWRIQRHVGFVDFLIHFLVTHPSQILGTHTHIQTQRKEYTNTDTHTLTQSATKTDTQRDTDRDSLDPRQINTQSEIGYTVSLE